MSTVLGRSSAWTSPASPVASLGHRAVMVSALARLARRRDRGSVAVRAALRGAALGRLTAQERSWAGRIEAHRQQLPRLAAQRATELEPGPSRRDGHQLLTDLSAACRWISIAPLWGRFLMRLVRELSPRSCLELGTGFGISTAYQAAALELNGRGSLISLDMEDMTDLAAPGLSDLGLANRVELVPGRIEETLGIALERTGPIDYALLDADHTEEGMLREFDTILPYLSEESVVVVDDINWAEESRRAWAAVGSRGGVRGAIGLRRLGVAVVSQS
jgi:predicted O-methyltransferase YrrM